VDVLSHEDVKVAVDNLLRASRSPANDLMKSLMLHGWKPETQASAFIFGMALYVEKYGEGKETGHNVEEAMAYAQAEIVKNPVVSSFMAHNVSANVNKAAGV